MSRIFSTGVEVPSAGDRHPSEAWWARVGATTNAAILNETAKARDAATASVDALRKTVTQDYVDRATASQYGIPGPASTIRIGTVQGGTTAGASMSGTAPAQTLNLTLPQGPRGPEGPGGAFQMTETSSPGLFTTSQQTIQDVAERKLAASVAGWKSGEVYLSRYGPLVTLQFDALVMSADATSWKTLAALIPPGFRPPRDVDFQTAPRVTSEHTGTVRTMANGNVVVYKYATDQVVRGMWVWRTNEPFPTT